MTRTSGNALLAGALLLLFAAAPDAGELRLLMFDAADCDYCERFRHELGEVYPRTAEGRRAPLRRRALSEGVPAQLTLREPVRYTPTFVLLRGDEELGRITGYPGESHFWGLLGVLLSPMTTEHSK